MPNGCFGKITNEKALKEGIVEGNAFLANAIEKLVKKPSSIMRIQADLKWPKLGDSGSGLSAADFYESFEDNCGLANDSNGMLPSEMQK